MKNKRGFISTSIIYSFFLVFILLMIAILMSFANKEFLIKKLIDGGKYPNTDILISCEKNDLLSDCLFIAEHIEAENLHQKVQIDGKDSLNTEEVYQYFANVNLTSIEGGIDLTLEKSKVIENIKSVIRGPKDYATYKSVQIASSPEATKYEIGIYSFSDDLGTSYYYRGAENDNYVLFADKLWSIARINGDGSIRLVYQGDWSEINSLTGTEVKKNYIKNYGYIDMDKDDKKTSNDARHYNVNNTGEFFGNADEFMYALNSDLIIKYCNDENPEVSNSLKEFINKKGCAWAESYGDYKLKKILNFGNSSYNGSYSLYNAGFMSNAKNAWGDTQAKISNSAPSTIMSILNAWYKTNIEDYEKDFVNKNALFCANKDVVLQEGSDYYLDDRYCYCYANNPVIGALNTSITKLDDGLFTYCSNTVGTGQCSNNGFINGLQLNYHLKTSIETVRNSRLYALKCLDLSNSSFSVNIDGTTKIDYPIGLLTASELELAGATYREGNSNFHLATNYNYWLADLAFGNNNTGYNSTYYFAYIGDANGSSDELNTKDHVLDVLDDYKQVAYIKPVINLKANVKYLDGNGSLENPYIIGV